MKMTSEELIKERQNARYNLTKQIQNVKQWVAEESAEKVQAGVEKVKSSFSHFELTHNLVHKQLIEESCVIESEIYYSETQAYYIDELMKINSWRRQFSQPTIDIQSAMNKLISICSELVTYMNLPRIEIDEFDGNPLRFMEFCSAFDECVCKFTNDGQMKLNRLLQYTKGDAKEAIRSCAMIGGEEGYQQARKILVSRFGEKELIAKSFISKITNKVSVESASQMRKFADELSNSFTILKRLDMLQEVNSQMFIVDIVKKLQPEIAEEWREFALEMKTSKGKYPVFCDFVDFVQKEADCAMDAVYGYSFKNITVNKNMVCNTLTNPPVNSVCQSYSSNLRCILCAQSHKLMYCRKFKSLNPRERYNFVVQNKLCENCLLGNHNVKNCYKSTVCSVPSCSKKHSKFIHIDND